MDHNLGCRFNVGNVQTMLLAMSEMEDDDWDITISKHYGRYAVHHWTGQRIELLRWNGTYKLPPMYAVPAKGQNKVEANSVVEKDISQTTEARDDEGFQWQPVGHV